MKKVIKTSVKKVLSKKEQKAVMGGICPGGGYPVPCCGGPKKCPEVCPC